MRNRPASELDVVSEAEIPDHEAVAWQYKNGSCTDQKQSKVIPGREGAGDDDGASEAVAHHRK